MLKSIEKIDKLFQTRSRRKRKSRNHSPSFFNRGFSSTNVERKNNSTTIPKNTDYQFYTRLGVYSFSFLQLARAIFPRSYEERMVYKRLYRFFLGRIRFRARGERLPPPHHQSTTNRRRSSNVVSLVGARKWRRMTNETATMLAILSLILFLETSTLHVPPSSLG